MSGILTSILAIAKDIAAEGIGKTRKNEQQHYDFRGVDEVMNAFAPLFSKHGVFVSPEFKDRTCIERASRGGGALFDVVLQGSFTFTHADGSAIKVGPFYGEAMDSADKATNKAMAVAFKYCLFQTFCVPLEGVTGGDADSVSPDVAPMDQGVADWIEALKDVTTWEAYDAMRDEMLEHFNHKPPASVKRVFSERMKMLPSRVQP